MYHYTVIQWLFFFYIYCVFGWCFESAYVSLKKKELVNRGFLYGPFLPIYGCGAIMMLFVSMPFQENLFLMFIAGMLGATVLEYVTGVLMEAMFKVRYWDYSNQRFNFQGHICLGSSLAWGAFTLLLTQAIHKPVEQMVKAIPETALLVVVMIVSLILITDTIASVKAAMDLRAVLFRLEKAKQEMEHLKRRLDVVIALANEENEQRKEQWEQKLEEKIQQMGFIARSTFKRNPSMVSVRFKESVEELKQASMKRMSRIKKNKEQISVTEQSGEKTAKQKAENE